MGSTSLLVKNLGLGKLELIHIGVGCRCLNELRGIQQTERAHSRFPVPRLSSVRPSGSRSTTRDCGLGYPETGLTPTPQLHLEFYETPRPLRPKSTWTIYNPLSDEDPQQSRSYS